MLVRFLKTGTYAQIGTPLEPRFSASEDEEVELSELCAAVYIRMGVCEKVESKPETKVERPDSDTRSRAEGSTKKRKRFTRKKE